MSAETLTPPRADVRAASPSWQKWMGIVLSALPVLALVASSFMKVSHGASFVPTWVNELGWPLDVLTGVGILEFVCALHYAIPKTSVLGAVLLTGYLGAAISAHVRVHASFVPPLVLAILVWAGLYLREPRVRALGPLRSPSRLPAGS